MSIKGWGKHDIGAPFNKLTEAGYTRQIMMANNHSLFVKNGGANDQEGDEVQFLARAFSGQLTKKEKKDVDISLLELDEYNLTQSIMGVMNDHETFDIVGKELIQPKLSIEEWEKCDFNVAKFIEKGIKERKL